MSSTVPILVFLSAFAQPDMGVKLNGGLSRISNTFWQPNSRDHVRFAPSGQAGFYYRVDVSDRSMLGAEVLFSQIGGKERSEGDLADRNGNIVGYIELETWTHLSYVTLPVYYGFKLNQLTINAGFQISYSVYSWGRYRSSGMRNGAPFEYETTDGNLGFDKFDYGVRTGIFYDLSKRVAIEGYYYYGLNNILHKEATSAMRIQQLTIGLRYTFFSADTGNSNE